ncbi:LacI family DNA-binding transcriptional regulator [Longispora sp. NPDC051575]|uniref:LacI family DNA-binding transcriptional regulator n=1 Tax=Longispora sp. NPDC051575 TaxID=3154943 RepID=UPI0034209E17
MGASIYDVAREAGVALGTVSRVLNGVANVSPATRAKVTAAMQRLDYQPSIVARSLASGSSRSVALIVPDLANPFFADIAAGIEEVTDAQDYVVIICSASSTIERERRYLKLLAARQVDGLMLIGSNLTPEGLAQLTQGTPIVQVDREVKSPGAVVVKIDHRLGGYLATSHLLDLGHRTVAFLGGDQDNDASRARYWGYQDALRERGIDPVETRVARGSLDMAGGQSATAELLKRQEEFTAVFATNDLMAMGAMVTLRAAGLSVPADVSLIGFDDIHLAQCTEPPLTTIRQPAAQLGRRAAELLLLQIAEQPHDTRVILDPELVVRGTTRHV